MLRQQQEKPDGQFNHCLADYVAPLDCGGSTTSAASRSRPATASRRFAARVQGAHDDYSAIMSQALGDRLAEAMAELFHKRAREACGFGRTENLGPRT
jgi:5-methyltetrahydrofolate--homocysteine methyltransferase